MKRPEFVSDPSCIYHIYNRGVEKRDIFLDDQDYFRFIHDLFEFNDTKAAKQFSRYENLISKDGQGKERELIIEILAFSLMPNHYHLLVRQLRDDGIVKFMQKIGTGYTMYFNERHERSGVLFQGKFKAKIINNENYFIYIPYYIHSNPVDLIYHNWKEKGIKDIKKTFQFLENYRWSSYLDYIGKKNFPSVIATKFLTELWDGPEKYKLLMQEWLRDMNVNLEKIKSFIID